jgi:hypothetical protein
MKTKSLIFAIAKAIFIFIIVCCLFSCTENGSGNAVTGETKYTIEIIDGCEYLKRYEGYQSGYSFSHKGNCNNPIHYKVIHDTIYITKK